MSPQQFFSYKQIEEITGVKTNTFLKWISEFELNQSDFFINNKREKMYSKQAVISIFELRGKTDLVQKISTYVDMCGDAGSQNSENRDLVLVENRQEKVLQSVLESNQNLSKAIESNSKSHNDSNKTIQFLLAKQENVERSNQRLYEQNERLLRQVGKLLLLEEKRQEQLELQNTQKPDPVETPQPAFSFLGFTISRTRSNRAQAA